MPFFRSTGWPLQRCHSGLLVVVFLPGAVIMGHLPYAGKEDGQFFWDTKAPKVLEWSILPSNRVPMELWSRCVLAPMVHLMLAGGSGRDSYDGTSPITWQGRWSVLLSHKGPQSPGVGMAWPPWCTPAGGWLRTGQLSWDVPHILARKMVRSCEPSRPPEPWSHYGLASMVHPLRWTAQEGAVALRGPPPAGMTDD
ncbi:uncharacterized protein LOC108293711 isoform X16 [Cebus imitator]|uniref:uncharacterized protein LOC108293711 isoform X16 n=1 Tax=Cebus imitator TaxID=2715852 RepID=UPI0018986744|nr:uncharacterized protein LOC108293711 isoform X16 [Cebus imitator]